MLSIALQAATTIVVVATGLALFRLVRGPTVPDRILALDTLAIDAIAIVLLHGIAIASGAYFEAALLIAMMGFVGTVAFCKFLIGGDIIE